jgi:predicted component of type VI protein secretion system
VEFRPGTLYAVGIPVVPLVQWVAKKAGEAIRKSNARKAREEVRRDLEQFLACQAEPSKPGC